MLLWSLTTAAMAVSLPTRPNTDLLISALMNSRENNDSSSTSSEVKKSISTNSNATNSKSSITTNSNATNHHQRQLQHYIFNNTSARGPTLATAKKKLPIALLTLKR